MITVVEEKAVLGEFEVRQQLSC